MSFTGHDVVLAARDGSAFFDSDRIPGGPASRLLTEIVRDLTYKIVLRDPELLAVNALLPMSDITASVAGGNLTPVALPDAMLYLRALTYDVDLNTTVPVNLPTELPMVTPDRASTWEGRAWYLTGVGITNFLTTQTALFCGNASDWALVQSVYLTYVPTPAEASDTAGTAGTIVLPPSARSCMIAKLAYAFARRVNGMPVSLNQPDLAQSISLDVTGFARDAQTAEQQFLASITNQRRKESRHTIRGER